MALPVQRLEAAHQVGEKVKVDIGGCRENRTRGTIVAVVWHPELTTYQVDFPEFRGDPRIPGFYTAQDLLVSD